MGNFPLFVIILCTMKHWTTRVTRDGEDITSHTTVKQKCGAWGFKVRLYRALLIHYAKNLSIARVIN